MWRGWKKVAIGVGLAACAAGAVYVFLPERPALHPARRAGDSTSAGDVSGVEPQNVQRASFKNSDPPWMASVKPLILERPLDGELLVRKLSAAAQLTPLEEQRVRDSLQGIARAQADVATVKDLNFRNELSHKLARQAMRELMTAVAQEREVAVRDYLRDGVPSIAFSK